MRRLIPGLVLLAACTDTPDTTLSTGARTDADSGLFDPTMPRPEPSAISAPLPGFMRGINLGNCLEAPSEGAWGPRLSAQHFATAAAAGFDHVRLPVRFTTSERSDPNPPYTIQETFFTRVDWAIDQALANQLSIIVDLHHFMEIHTNPAANTARFYALWRQIAARYADRPPEVAFELLNEPNGALSPRLLNEITAGALAIIREANPTRIVMADSYSWSESGYLKDLALPKDDPNVVAHFHMYQPMSFTHQGAPWLDASFQTRGVLFPGPPATPLNPSSATLAVSWMADFFAAYNRLPIDQNPAGPATIYDHFENASRFVKATGKRVYLGEFGAIDQADPISRENYVWLIRTEAERRGMGFAYWDDGGSFKAMDPASGTWNEGLRRALVD